MNNYVVKSDNEKVIGLIKLIDEAALKGEVEFNVIKENDKVLTIDMVKL